jgi:chemotaxis protein histidine kinase CheA
MMIVNVTRDDLRDEFMMADDAFALSPISARAVQPSEEDYDAIRDAFMETSRGRWFLGEYAKRNRNADTRMVLDAVARVEENLAAQRQAAPDNGLAEALVAIRRAVGSARAAASGAIDGLALEETLTPVRKGARVIREIAWRWREIGADGRICDLLDSQVNAIEASCGQISSTDPKAALSAAFDLIEAQIAELDDSDTASPQAAETAVSPPSSVSSSGEPGEMPAADFEMAPAAAATSDFDAAMIAPAVPAEAMEMTAEAADTQAPDTQAPDTQAADAQAGDFAAPEALDVDAQDEALLQMVALEMAAPDPFDIDLPANTVPEDIHVAELPPAVVAQQPAPTAVPALSPSPLTSLQPSLQASLQASPQPPLEASPEPAPEPSLGSTLIASGFLRKPHASHSDPLAPIRRMSQAEKIAFFS